MTETSSITAPIVKALKEAGYFVLRLNSGKARMGNRHIQLCPAGTADVLLCIPFKMPIWIETKAEKGKQTEEQLNFAFDVEALGHTYLVARSLDDVLGALK